MMNDIKNDIEAVLKNKWYVKDANHTVYSGDTISRDEKIAVRRMMSRYWENSSPFALDLIGAVIRQGSFIEKMHSINWLHSPACGSTMTRLLTKYTRYFQLLARYTDQLPTLDIDLAWHTHQLSPVSYFNYSISKTGIFIDHDDKIEETALSTAFEWTSKIYQEKFKEIYSECTWWYCESIRESHTSSLKRVFGHNEAIEAQLDTLSKVHSPSDPHLTPHISAHNAIKAQPDEAASVRKSNMQQKLERDYQKVVQRAKKQGQEPSVRDDYMYAYSYGSPMYMPYYAPYMSDPCITGAMYASNPSCANMQAGAAGNCCQGACGGGVAAGACGDATGGCVGGPVC